MSRADLEARWAADPDPVFRKARELALAVQPRGWYDTESGARWMAMHAAERILALEELVRQGSTLGHWTDWGDNVVDFAKACEAALTPRGT